MKTFMTSKPQESQNSSDSNFAIFPRHDSADYQDALMKLLPPGRFYSTDSLAKHSPDLVEIIDALSESLAAFDPSFEFLITQSIPPISTLMIDDWILLLEIPIDSNTSLETKRFLLSQFLSRTTPSSENDLKNLAFSYGATLRIQRPYFKIASLEDFRFGERLFNLRFSAALTFVIKHETRIPALEEVFLKRLPAPIIACFVYE